MDKNVELSIGNDVTMRSSAAGVLGRVDQYELLRELGGGGFGTVYLAKDTVSGVEVAVKGLPPLVRNNKEELENIRANFALVSRLHHPNIAAALVLHPARSVSYSDKSVAENLRVFEGDTLMVMEYAPGVTLSQWRKQFPEKKVPIVQAVSITRQIALALDYAHEQKIVHRDIKPSNVMVETRPDGTPIARVLDFGLAAEIRSSMGRVSREIRDTSGTRPYMAPEQWLGGRQGPATDQYSLAVLFHELVTGEVPFASVFETGDPVVMMNVVGREKPTIVPFLPSRAGKALVRALSKTPESRFETCETFVAALNSKGRHSMFGLKQLVVCGCCLALAAGGFCWWQEHRKAKLASEKAVGLASGVSEVSEPSVRSQPALRADVVQAAEGRSRDEKTGDAHSFSAEDMKSKAVVLQKDGQPTPGSVKSIVLPGGATMKMAYCPPGEFVMGSPKSESGRDANGEEQHRVKLTKGFWMGVTEVTQRQWKSVMGNNPSEFDGEDLPVEGVSWEDCAAFCRKAGLGLRLPTEAEWEYACRAGSQGPFAGTGKLDEMGWFDDNSKSETHPVGQKHPNAWGIYDMHGNVWEWCSDWYGDYSTDEQEDAKGPASGDYRVQRGGSWYADKNGCRSASRDKDSAGKRHYYIGVRLCCSAEITEAETDAKALAAEKQAPDQKAAEEAERKRGADQKAALAAMKANTEAVKAAFDAERYEEVARLLPMSDQEDVDVNFVHGWMILRGREFKKDEKLALAHFRKAAGNGHAEAWRKIGVMYQCGSAGLNEDYAKAAECFRKAIDGGDGVACQILAGMYEKGKGVAVDLQEAKKLCEMAISRNRPGAKVDLDRIEKKLATEAESTRVSAATKVDRVEVVSPLQSSDTHFLRDAIRPYIDNGSLPGAIGVYIKNGVQEEVCMGWADVQRKQPLRMNSTFMICSQSKGFCGVCLALLIEEGRLGVDDEVARYLPAFKKMFVSKNGKTHPANNQITLRHLMTDCAGFSFDLEAKTNKGWVAISVRDAADAAARCVLLNEPGAVRQYSNIGCEVVARVIEVVTGQSYEEYLAAKVLNPLGMVDTTFNPTDEQLSRRMLMYQLDSKSAPVPTENKWMPAPHNGPTVRVSAASGLWSTANDLLKFYKMLMREGVSENGTRILKAETVKRYLATSLLPKNLSAKGCYYSLGLAPNVSDNSFGHGGAWGNNCRVSSVSRELNFWVVQLCGSPRPWDAARQKAFEDFKKNVLAAEGPVR